MNPAPPVTRTVRAEPVPSPPAIVTRVISFPVRPAKVRYRPARNLVVPASCPLLLAPRLGCTLTKRERRLRLPGRVPLGRAARTLCLLTHLFDLCAQSLVLAHLDLQKSHREARLLFETPRSQQIHVRRLVIAVLEVGDLDPPFADQGA